jgi:hypothetical protein
MLNFSNLHTVGGKKKRDSRLLSRIQRARQQASKAAGGGAQPFPISARLPPLPAACLPGTSYLAPRDANATSSVVVVVDADRHGRGGIPSRPSADEGA